MRIVIIGSGNVATQLGLILNESNKILQVFSRDIKKAKKLALEFGCTGVSDYAKINKEADLYIISVKDDALKEVCSKLEINQGIVVHTSGSVSLDVFQPKFSRFGVVYPLMTFSKEKISFSYPICLEASDEQTMANLQKIGTNIGQTIELNSEQRKKLHLAAVTVNNFTNYLFTLAFNYLNKNEIDSKLLYPLMSETVSKALKESPTKIQTGPAKRKDREIIKKHIEMLESFPEYKKLYSFVSEQIFNYHNKQ